MFAAKKNALGNGSVQGPNKAGTGLCCSKEAGCRDGRAFVHTIAEVDSCVVELCKVFPAVHNRLLKKVLHHSLKRRKGTTQRKRSRGREREREVEREREKGGG